MQPKTPIVKTVTSLSQAKACMDELFLDGGRRGLLITSDKIYDATSTVKVSTLDMTINAISDMSKRSEAFKFLQFEGSASNVTKIQAAIDPSGSRIAGVPNIYIRGSISQADNAVARDSQSVGITVPFASLGKGQDRSADTISVDLQMADLASRTILPGISTSNTITVVSDSDSDSARGLISNGGVGAALSISLSSSQREGRGQAVRTLLEYSLIELLGKYTHVPYQRCLGLPSTDPTSMQAAQDYYDKLVPQVRTQAVQSALAATREYSGAADGMMSDAFSSALTAAKMKRGLNADGRVDFQIFNALYEENVLPKRLNDSKPTGQAVATPAAIPVPTAGRDPFGLSLALANPALALNARVNVRVSVDTPSRLYCYYEYHEKGAIQVARIFPNRFQTDNRVSPGRGIMVPSPQDPFQIVLNDTAPEAIGCVATSIEYRGAKALPLLDEGDLKPIKTQAGWTGLPYVFYQHQQVDSLRTSVKKISFQVNG